FCSRATSATAICSLSLHDALPILSVWNTTLPGVVATFLPSSKAEVSVILTRRLPPPSSTSRSRLLRPLSRFWPWLLTVSRKTSRSEEHTSELQSRENLVCRLRLEK